MVFSYVALASLFAAAHTSRACVTPNSGDPFPHLEWIANLRKSNDGKVNRVQDLGLGPFFKVKFGEGEKPITITAEEKWDLETTGINFLDVTEFDLEEETAARREGVSIQAYPTAVAFSSQVNSVISTLRQANLQTYLSELTTWNNRYYRATTGTQAADALFAKVQSLASGAPGTGGAITISQVTHSGFNQRSVVGRIAGSVAGAATVIVGAHLDTINQGNPTSGRAPGADDNGSGSVNLLEAWRALTTSGFRPRQNVEFHWYAGEEGGLLGSQAIARSYASSGRAVRAMMNLDMTAWVASGSTRQIGWVTDRTDSTLNAFGKLLVRSYLTGVVATDDFCGYACSDHAAWNTAGFPATYPFESITRFQNPNIHSASDTTSFSQFNFVHMHEFSKLVVAFVTELGLE